MRTSARSARRQTVRATWAMAAGRVPPGRMNSFSGPRSALKRSTASSSRATCASVTAAYPGTDSSPPRSKRSCWIAVRHAATAVGQRLAQQESQRRVELVDLADGGDPCRILADARAVAEAGGPGVAGAGDDLGEAVAHGRWLVRRPPNWDVRGSGFSRTESSRSESSWVRLQPDGAAGSKRSPRPPRDGRRSLSKTAGEGKRRRAARKTQRPQYHCPVRARLRRDRAPRPGPPMTRPNPFERDLDRNAANYTPLTPLSLIARTAYTFPRHLAVVHGDRRYTWAETYARARRLASALAKAGVGTGRHRRADGGQHAGNVRSPLRRADDRRRAQHAQYAARRRGDRLHAAARRGQGAHHRHRILADGREGPRANGFQAPRHRHRRRARARGEPSRGNRLRSIHRRRRSGVCVAASGGRMERDLAQLHVRHDRQSEGRRLSPSRRVPERAVQHHRLGDAAARRVPVDAADVPLQRLVLRVDDGGQRGRQRLPAQGRGEGDSRRDPHAPGHPLLRRADRPPDADQRAGRR